MSAADRDVGDVVGVDERVELAVGGGEHHLAGPDRVEEEVLAEDLHEPGAANDGHVGAGGLQLTLAPLGLVLASAGQHHQPSDAVLDGEFGERPGGLGCLGDDQVGVGDVDRTCALQHRRPGGLVGPVERRLSRAGAHPHGETACAEPFDDPPARLARAAEHQCRLLVVCNLVHRGSSLDGAMYLSSTLRKRIRWNNARSSLIHARSSSVLWTRCVFGRQTGPMRGEDPWTTPDPLGEALHVLRMSGTFYCRSELTAPVGAGPAS